MPVTYLVTGASDVVPTHENLRRSGRRVKYGSEVTRTAPEELRLGMKYVVVAHGDQDGVIYWSNDGAGDEIPWLWPGMNPAPGRARVYLYCCNAGPELTRALKSCDCFGHSSKIPAPVNEARAVVLEYLNEVDRLMEGEEFNVGSWRDQLIKFVGIQWDRELEEPTSLLGPSFWMSLAKSLRPHAQAEI